MYGYLIHHGIKGQKWGVRRFQNADGSLTPAGKKRYSKDRVFISGSSKTQDKTSNYYRKQLPKDIRNEIDGYIKKGDKILVGDAPGIDRQVQNYLNKKGYSNVVVYGPGKQVRFSANKNWKTKPIDAPEFEPMSPEWLRKKDIAMTNDSTKGLAIVLENGGAKATRNNVERLVEAGKDVKVYELSTKGDKYIQDIIKKLDDYPTFDPYEAMDKIDKSLNNKERAFLGYGSNTSNTPVEKFFFDKDLSAYLIATDYHGKYKDEHPIPGKVLGIAAKKESRGKGITDKLIKDAKDFYKNDKLVAEIDKENIASKKLFERNGFKKVYDDGYIDYYQWKNSQ